MSFKTLPEAAAGQQRDRVSARPLLGMLLGREAMTAVRIRIGLIPMMIHLSWAFFYAHAASHQQISRTGAAFMIATNLVGMFAFYAIMRSGLSRGWRDAGLVLPQMLWASLSTVSGMALAPTLQPALLQVLCMIQLFGFVSLRPAQLWLSNGATLAMLAALVCAGTCGAVPGFEPMEQVTPILLTVLSLVLLTIITTEQSRRRGLLVTQKADLAKALAAVQELVVRDTLTGLYTRGHMESLLAEELARSLASGVPFSVALLDIDHFKRINDAFGHAAGDAVLRDFAGTARRALRQTDTLARWGGEEFLVLSPGNDLDSPATLQTPLERLRRILLNKDASLPQSAPRVTFSAGVSAWRLQESVDQTIARADGALYAAKNAGRDRLVVDDELERERAAAKQPRACGATSPWATGQAAGCDRPDAVPTLGAAQSFAKL